MKSYENLYKELAESTNGSVVYEHKPAGGRTSPGTQYCRIDYAIEGFSFSYIARFGFLPKDFSGFFVPVITDSVLKVRERWSLDRWRLFSGKDTIKFGNQKIDQNLKISSDNEAFAIDLLRSHKLQGELVNCVKKTARFEIFSNSKNYFPELQEAPSVMGLLSDEWLLEKDEYMKRLESFVKIIQETNSIVYKVTM